MVSIMELFQECRFFTCDEHKLNIVDVEFTGRISGT